MYDHRTENSEDTPEGVNKMESAMESEASQAESSQPGTVQKLRMWPLALIAAIQLGIIVFWLLPQMNNMIRFVAMMAGPLICGGTFALLLMFAARLGFKRGALVVLATVVLAAVVGATAAPRSGIAAWMLGVPLSMVLTVVGFWVSGSMSSTKSVRTAILLSAVGWAFLAMLRLDGFDGAYMPELSWRWSPSAEQRVMEKLANESPVAADTVAQWVPSTTGWTGFRGPNRDSRVTEKLSRQDWNTQPPEEVWRRPVGPGWSSMAVVSGRLFTQEQRGEKEAVTCYNAVDGKLIWSHEEESRFEEVVSGAGPRATPTVVNNRVYTVGAKAILLGLNASDGTVVWRRDLMKDYGSTLPIWGFSASPLVVDGKVVAFVGGSGDNGLMAFDADTGEEVWSMPTANGNYGSAQLVNFAGERHIAFTEPSFVKGLSIDSGEELWQAEVLDPRDFPMVQPQQIDDSHLVVTTGDGKDSVCVEVTKSDSWNAKQVWKTRYLKPSYNDFLYHDGALYGFDKQIFACINAETGERFWKKGRYGFGQAILLQSTSQIVVQAESGKLVLIDASTKQLNEVGTIDAMSAKTWNHPAIDSGMLFVRNAEEMVCYKLK
ncbi:MAG: PQQ-binding-like beta-propeller repeat protein [Planctomycetaceae bacterium]